MDFNNGNSENGNNNETQPFYSSNPYSQPQGSFQGNPQGSSQSQQQGAYQGQSQGGPQGAYQGGPQGAYQGQSQVGPQGAYQGSFQANPQGTYQNQFQGSYNSPQGQGVPVYSTSQRTSGEYDPYAEMNNPYAQMPEQKPSANACQVISLILGILSIICCCFGLVSVLFAVAGIILAIVGNKKQKHGVGTGGLVCSIIGLVLSLIILAISIGTRNHLDPSSMNEIFEYLEEFEEF